MKKKCGLGLTCKYSLAHTRVHINLQVWKKESLGQLIVPAVSIGPSTTCTIELTNFWSWENPPPQMDTEDIQKSISPQDTKKEDIFAIIQNISGIAQD
jgi:hypothetical protein